MFHLSSPSVFLIFVLFNRLFSSVPSSLPVQTILVFALIMNLLGFVFTYGVSYFIFIYYFISQFVLLYIINHSILCVSSQAIFLTTLLHVFLRSSSPYLFARWTSFIAAIFTTCPTHLDCCSYNYGITQFLISSIFGFLSIFLENSISIFYLSISLLSSPIFQFLFKIYSLLTISIS